MEDFIWVVIPFFTGDIHLAKSLLQWIDQLDSKLSHGALLACDPSIGWGDASDLLNLAARAFQRTEIINAPEVVSSWPAGPNALFKCAAQWFESRRIGPWLWCEPDAIPLKKGWLDTLQNSYFAAGKPFFGSVMQSTELDLPERYLAGVAVYPMDCWKRIAPAWREDKAFDVATASATVPFAANTPLIQHFWGQKDLPPTFVAEKTAGSPVNAFTLDKINPEAVIFHRSKDSSLLNLLGYREPMLTAITLDVVLPFCANDAKLMLKNLRWLSALHGKKKAAAVLLVDSSAPQTLANLIDQAARAVFERVEAHYYSSPVSGWPNGPNRAFQEACNVMSQRQGSPGWFWMEADAVPVANDWLEQLSFEYSMAGKPFMGTVIDFMGHHLNGVAVYPLNVRHYCKSLMNIKEAWDVALNHEIFLHRHRANHLIQHCLTPPSFASKPDLNVIDPDVVVFHPDKSGQLMDRLSERLFR